MIYEIYYLFESSNSYLSAKDAVRVDNINCLDDKLKQLKSLEDIVFVYLPESKRKVEFRLASTSNIEFMIYDAYLAGVFYREFDIAENKNIVNSFDDYIDKPKEYGFVFEYW